MSGRYLIIDEWERRTGAYGCWSGQDCFECKGTGETLERTACKHCGGTGEYYQSKVYQITFTKGFIANEC